MKDKIFGVLQRVGRSFMLPIAILPVAGLLLGIGGSFTNATMIEAYHLEAVLGEGTLLHGLLLVLSDCGNIVLAIKERYETIATNIHINACWNNRRLVRNFYSIV